MGKSQVWGETRWECIPCTLVFQLSAHGTKGSGHTSHPAAGLLNSLNFQSGAAGVSPKAVQWWERERRAHLQP